MSMPLSTPRLKRQNAQRRNNDRRGMGQLTTVSSISPIVPRLRTVMKYCEVVAFGAIPLVEYLFNLNSLFDPNQTGVGHQPLGFDQIKAMYDKYRVYKCKYTIRFANNVGTASVCIAVPTNTTGGIGSILTASEQPYAKISKVCQQTGVTDVISGMVDLPTLNGKTLRQYADDDITASATTTSPTEQLILHVLGGSLDGSNVNSVAHVMLEYDVEFFDPVQLATS